MSAQNEWVLVSSANSDGSPYRYQLQCWMRWTSQSLDQNSTTVQRRLDAVQNNTAFFNNYDTQFSVGGSQAASGTWRTGSGAWGTKTPYTDTLVIYHNPEGAGQATMSASAAAKSPAGAVTVPERPLVLPTIARASSVSLGSTSVALGGTQNVTITRASTSFTHKVELLLGGQVVASTTGIATSTVLTIPTSAAALIPNAASSIAYVRVTTMNGTTVIGTSQAAFSVTVPTTTAYQPLFTLAVARVDNTVPVAWALYVQGKSQVKLTLSSVTAGSGATIASWQASVAGQTNSGSPDSYVWTSELLSSAGAQTITVSVTDSRGRTYTQTSSITVQPYSVPTIQGSIVRTDSTGNPTTTRGTASRSKPRQLSPRSVPKTL